MKYHLILVATLVILTVSFDQSVADPANIIEAIPFEVLKVLASAEKTLMSYNFTQMQMPRSSFTFSLSLPINFILNTNSTLIKKLAPLHVNVAFEIVLHDINLEGKLRVQGLNDQVWHTCNFRSMVSEGNLTIRFDAYYNHMNKATIIKSELIDNAYYVRDFFWLDCPIGNWDCVNAEGTAYGSLNGQFPKEFENRVHEIIFKATPEITSNLASLDFF